MLYEFYVNKNNVKKKRNIVLRNDSDLAFSPFTQLRPSTMYYPP